jgi:hypothetical protein
MSKENEAERIKKISDERSGKFYNTMKNEAPEFYSRKNTMVLTTLAF